MKKSPLNYVGGKHKLISQLQQIFPPCTPAFVDLFCGGLNVSLNIKAEKYIVNDICRQTIEFYQYLQETPEEVVLSSIDCLIEQYDISKTNKDGYLMLRKDYNNSSTPLKLFVLVSNSFNHQIRFNSKGEFNMPFGKDRSHFNPKMKENLLNLIDFLKNNKIQFTSLDFREYQNLLPPDHFVYCDPPYRLSTAVYNTGWQEQDDQDLLELLDHIDKINGKFALSCVMIHNGVENKIIKDWSNKYTTHQIEWKYGNSNYHKKNRSPGIEACITNYLQYF